MQILKNYNIIHMSITTLTQLGKGLMYMRDLSTDLISEDRDTMRG